MATWTPSRIDLIFTGRYDEGKGAASPGLWPGMMLTKNSSDLLIPHNVIGGSGPLMVAREDVLKGGDITQQLAASSDGTPFLRPNKGDLLLMLLQNLQNVATQTPLMSAGDGTLITAEQSPLYNIVAASTVVTNVGTETTFSNGSYALPANTLQVGDIIHIRSKVFCVAENSTNTHRIRTYVGSTALADSTAIQLAANDYVIEDIFLTVRTITSSGTFIADGVVSYTISATATVAPFTIASTAIDTTAAQTFKTTTLASATSTGNQVRLDEFSVQLIRNSGLGAVVVCQEAIDNSGSTGTSGFNTAAFIRCQVI